jgi:hypothetical protein
MTEYQERRDQHQAGLNNYSINLAPGDIELLRARDLVRDKYGIDTRIPVVLAFRGTLEHFYVPLLVQEDEKAIYFQFPIRVRGDSGILSGEGWHIRGTFNRTMLDLIEGVEQLSKTDPTTPLKTLKLMSDSNGFVIYSEERNALLLQTISTPDQGTSNWREFEITGRDEDVQYWSGAIRMHVTEVLAVIDKDSEESGQLKVVRDSGWFGNSSSVTLTLNNSCRTLGGYLAFFETSTNGVQSDCLLTNEVLREIEVYRQRFGEK